MSALRPVANNAAPTRSVVTRHDLLQPHAVSYATASPSRTPGAAPFVTKYRWSPFASIARGPNDDPALGRFVLLSILLHAFLIVLFGSTSGERGSSSLGESSSQPLGVRLRPMSSVTATGLILAPGIESSLLGAVMMKRLAESKEQNAPQVSDRPPAPAAAPTPPPRRASRAPAATPSLPAPAVAPPQQQPPVDPAPSLNLSAPEILDRPLRPSSVVPPRTRRPSTPKVEQPVPEALPSPPIERTVTPPVPVPVPVPPAEPPKEVLKAPTPAPISQRTPDPIPNPTPQPARDEAPAPTPPVVAPVDPQTVQ